MNSVVTQRFIKCHDKLKEGNLIRSSRQFALSLDYLPQSLSEVLKGRRDVTIELVRKAVERYKLNPMYLYTGSGPMFMSNEDMKSFKLLTVVTNQHQENLIIHVPSQLHHKYVECINKPNFIQELPKFRLPDFQYDSGVFRSFDIVGDDMEPTLFIGEKVVCSFVEPELWELGIKSNFVYTIVTKSAIYTRRIQNKLDQPISVLELVPDNNGYSSVTVNVSDILEIWLIKTKICPFAPGNVLSRIGLKDEIKDLRQVINQQSKMLNTLQSTIDQMVYKDEN